MSGLHCACPPRHRPRHRRLRTTSSTQPAKTEPSLMLPLRNHPPNPRCLKRPRSPSRPIQAACAPTDTFSVKICTSGYRILYSPTWTTEQTVALFLDTYGLGVEWGPRVETLLLETVVPVVRRALEAAEHVLQDIQAQPGASLRWTAPKVVLTFIPRDQSRQARAHPPRSRPSSRSRDTARVRTGGVSLVLDLG